MNGRVVVVGMIIFAYYYEYDILKLDKLDHSEQVNVSLH